MKKLVGLAVVALLVVGIVKVVHGRTPEAKVAKACDNVMDQCGAYADLTAKDVEECKSDIGGARKELGDQFEPLVSCMADADSCGEIVGCMSGVAVGVLDHEIQGFSKGFHKTTHH